jgi:hypothetical protein
MRSPHVVALLSIGLGLVAAKDASAQAAWGEAAKNAAPPAPPPPGATGEEKKPANYNIEGTFKVSGSMGSGAVSVAKTKAKKEPASAAKIGAKKPSGNVAQWPGFRLTDDGGSEVMVEFSSNPTAPTEHRAAGSVTYVFKGAHVIKSNNQNPLITVHFNTPVSSARLVPKKDELHLVVDLRAGANAAPVFGMRAASDGDGQQFFVKFASGAWLPKGAENAEIAPAPTQKLKADGSAKPAASTTTPKTESGGKTGPAP